MIKSPCVIECVFAVPSNSHLVSSLTQTTKSNGREGDSSGGGHVHGLLSIKNELDAC